MWRGIYRCRRRLWDYSQPWGGLSPIPVCLRYGSENWATVSRLISHHMKQLRSMQRSTLQLASGIVHLPCQPPDHSWLFKYNPFLSRFFLRARSLWRNENLGGNPQWSPAGLPWPCTLPLLSLFTTLQWIPNLTQFRMFVAGLPS